MAIARTSPISKSVIFGCEIEKNLPRLDLVIDACQKIIVKPAEFYPAKLTPFFVRLVHVLSDGFARTVYRLKLQVADKDLDKLKAIESDRAVLMPNHPSLSDAIAPRSPLSAIGTAISLPRCSR